MTKPAKILVIESSPARLLKMTRLLKAAGFETLEAGTGLSGIDLARTSAPDLILLDARLPDQDPLDLCRQFKSQQALAPAYAVLLTTSETSEDPGAAAIEAGANGYLSRSLGNQEFLARVHAFLRRQQAEAQLKKTQGDLEQRVEERTAQLLAANAALHEEVAVRKLAEEAQARYATRLKNLHLIDLAILAAQSPEAIAEAALLRMRNLLPYEQASIVELDPVISQATILAAYNGGVTCAGGRWTLAFDQLQLSHTLQSGQVRRITNLPNLFQVPGLSQSSPDKTWESILDLPLNAEGKLIGALNLATDQPGAFSLEHQEIAQEIADQLAVSIRHARLFEEVSTGREHLRALSLKLVEVQEAERRFIARELHDEIGQVLTSLKLVLDLGREPSSSASQNPLQEAVRMIDELMDRVRQLSLDLRPQMLDDLGLLPALDWHFKRYHKQTNIRVHFKFSPIPQRLPSHLETAAFRIIQEALTNVARYAGVPEATVRLWTEEKYLGIQVEDQGVGFDAAKALAAADSNGLSGMRERASLLGGEFTLESAQGSGTRLTVELPLRPVPVCLPASIR